MEDLHQIIEQLREWTYDVGTYQLRKLEEGFTYKTKSTETDIVTEVDKWSDKFLTEKIQKYYPQHSILSEEQGFINEGNSFTDRTYKLRFPAGAGYGEVG